MKSFQHFRVSVIVLIAMVSVVMSDNVQAQIQPASTASNSRTAGSDPGVLQEIVVTAQKKTENIMDVPVPVTVVTADTLTATNQVQLQDYYATIPGLNFALNDWGNPTVSIRGITTGGYVTPTVGIVVDDVPYGGSIGQAYSEFVPDFDPSDLVRIEVLRGPQGTLYGADSMGGLIKYVTADPSTEAFSGRLETGVSSVHNGAEQGYTTRGSVNVPLGDTLAVRMSAFSRQDPGYIDDPGLNAKGVNEDWAYGGHVSALWQPSQLFSVKLSGLIQHNEANGLTNVDIEPGLGDLQQSDVKGSGQSDRDFQAYSATIKGTLGNVDVTAVSGYNTVRSISGFDYSNTLGGAGWQAAYGAPGVPVTIGSFVQKFSQEIRFSGSIGQRVEWLAGGFYTDERAQFVERIYAADPSTGSIVSEPLTFIGPNNDSTYSAYAAFGDLTVHFSDRFDIQVGGRESFDRQVVEGGVQAVGPAVMAFYGVPTLIGPREKANDDAFTYLVTPELKISKDLMVYARLASGFEPGGPNAPNNALLGLPTQVNPTTTYNYEIGTKGEFLDHRLTVDASLYYIDWKKIQLYLVDPQTGTSYIANGGGAKSEGVELSVEARPLRGLKVAGWIALDEAVLTDAFPSNDAGPGGTGYYGVSGDRLPYSSRFSGNFTLDEQFPIARGAYGFFGGTFSYVGNRVGIFQPTALRQMYPGYAQTNLDTGIRYDLWTCTFYVNNVFDKRGELNGGLGTFNPLAFNYIQPATVGLTISKSF